jgi:hypothetical protein
MEMAMIKNALWGPLTVELHGGKMILLGPRRTQTITDAEFQSPGCQQLYRAGKIYLVPPRPVPAEKTPTEDKNQSTQEE